jgi:hypothetical protein
VIIIIQARAGHELATSVLLRRGADLSMVDEIGLTPVDVARTKRIQTMLRASLLPLDKQPTFDSPLRAQSFGRLPSAGPAPTLPPVDLADVVEISSFSRVASAPRTQSGYVGEAQRQRCLERSKSEDENVDVVQRGPSARPAGVRLFTIVATILRIIRVSCISISG